VYLQHFDFTEAPFSLTPDTSFAFSSRSQQEALAMLLVAAKGGEGFVKITGEVGTGKTLTCRRLLAALAASPIGFQTVYIPNPCMSARSLLLALAAELQVALAPEAGEHELLAAINTALIEFADAEMPVVVCLDEVQAMPTDTIEALRLLSNLETEKRKLLQVVLFGQPEFDRRLAQRDLRQLAQRIVFQYRLVPLSCTETEHYLAHRIRVAGRRGDSLFAPAVARRLHQLTRGTPRLVNIVAHKSLLLAYGEGVLRVSRKHVERAAADTPQASRSWLPGWLQLRFEFGAHR
jgi:MSHA biogenesis protein MshM